MAKIRVLIVDDAALIRRMLSEDLSSDPEIEVVGTAPDGKIALEKIPQLNPDLVTLDLDMPVMGGIEALVEIRKVYKTLPVIIFSSLTEKGAQATLDALDKGANDYVTKSPHTGTARHSVREELIPRIKALCRRERPTPSSGATPRTKSNSTGPIEILAIGVSTGGPNALAMLFPKLMSNFPVPIVVVQHMPPMFTKLLAERLTSVSAFPVGEGQDKKILKPGEAWIAPGGFHMEVEKTGAGIFLKTHEGPPENSCRPAVDVLFRSVAKVYGPRVLAVVLTGMGQDGLRGSEVIVESGGRVLAQDEASSVVWGMPGAVSQAGLADKIMPLTDLAEEINRRLRNVTNRFESSPNREVPLALKT